MPVTVPNVPALPVNWAAFVDQVALGAEPVEAARALGYANPHATAAELIRRPDVRKALALSARARLEASAVPMALHTIEEILQDKKAPHAVRAKLAIALVDRLFPKDKPADTEKGKPLSDMTEDELRATVARLRDSPPGPADMLNVTPNNREGE